MDVSEVHTLSAALAKAINSLVNSFEAQTATIVHSIPIYRPETPGATPTVSVKIQVP